MENLMDNYNYYYIRILGDQRAFTFKSLFPSHPFDTHLMQL